MYILLLKFLDLFEACVACLIFIYSNVSCISKVNSRGIEYHSFNIFRYYVDFIGHHGLDERTIAYHVIMGEVCLVGTCGRFFWEVHVGGLFREVHVGGLFGRYMWEVFLGGICARCGIF